MKIRLKKILSLTLAIVAIFSFKIFTVNVSAVYTQKDIVNFDSENSTRVTGLIDSYYIGIARHGDYMHLVAKVYCAADVVKCGFKEIVIYRRVTGTTNWSIVTTIEDEYIDDCTHIYTREFSILPNFDYRATCIHYAKKNILMTQTIDDYSNVI